MKKLLVTILAIVYLGTSSGAMIHLHYCMGKLAETSFSKDTNKTCSKCGMKVSQKKSGCCKDESRFVKNSTDQKASISHYEFFQTDCQLEQAPSYIVPEEVFGNQLVVAHAPHAPPDQQGSPVYLRVCSFLI